ncbi:S41 family peptidase [Thermomonas sp. RSS23]|uniref:S41 family peptidase n=1 Tax=Thermomonas beijingensis TaxID=2872701 RepID=A0ABS7TH66_9GAMM|nr:S41 family peptidase [Thermomonas beijingensis]MBZ4187150.1 S41 family peptidase [Thermomonas beijingensis]
MEGSMKRTAFLTAIFMLPLACVAQQASSLETVVKLARERAFTSQYVNWPNVENKARAIAAQKDEDAAIRFVIRALGDGHSSYIPPNPEVTVAASGSRATQGARAQGMSQVKDSVGGIAVIEVRSWSGPMPEGTAAANTLRDQVSAALTSQRCGLVLDFSKNSGGNMWPMLSGLSALLDEGTLGFFQDANGVTRAIEKRGQTFLVDGAPQPFGRADGTASSVAPRRIGIIVGPRTASSGEIVPIMFHGQPNVRFFGRATSGHSTANSTFPLPNKGIVNITTATTLDRNRVEFGDQLVPDESGDEPLPQAAQWVASGCSRE